MTFFGTKCTLYLVCTARNLRACGLCLLRVPSGPGLFFKERVRNLPKIKVSISIDNELWEAIKIKAKYCDRTNSSYINKILKDNITSGLKDEENIKEIAEEHIRNS